MQQVRASSKKNAAIILGLTDPDRVYYSDFGDTNDADDSVLPYGEENQDHKEAKVNDSYI